MASLVTNATRIAAAKEKIKHSIRNKGIEVSDDLKIEDYSSKIDLIKQGIEEGTYNIEVYVRIDNVLIGEGVEFNVVGTDGTKTAATSRAGGYVFLTLNYGVGYDMQPKDQEAYYAESHPLIYHLKDEGNYFATDYYFTTAQSGGGELPEIKDCSYMFYRGARANEADNILPLIKEPTSLENCFYGTTLYPVNYNIFKRLIENADLSKCTTLSNALYECRCQNTDDQELTLNVIKATSLSSMISSMWFDAKHKIKININCPSATNMSSMITSIDNVSGRPQKGIELTVDFLGSSGKVTSAGNLFNKSCPSGKIYCQNINLDKVTSISTPFGNTTTLNQLTFQGSFGGLSTTASLTLDLSGQTTYFTLEVLTEMLNSISENTNGKTRIIKVSADLYSTIPEDLLLLAIEKGYELSA